MAQRSSRAGPIALLAAANRASLTAATRTSRLMPFSRSQNSRTAKKSAFISHYSSFSHRGNKKVGRIISDFFALANQQTLPFKGKIVTSNSVVKPQKAIFWIASGTNQPHLNRVRKLVLGKGLRALLHGTSVPGEP